MIKPKTIRAWRNWGFVGELAIGGSIAATICFFLISWVNVFGIIFCVGLFFWSVRRQDKLSKDMVEEAIDYIIETNRKEKADESNS